MRTIKTYRKVGAFYIAWEEDFSTSIRTNLSDPPARASFRLRDLSAARASAVAELNQLTTFTGVMGFALVGKKSFTGIVTEPSAPEPASRTTLRIGVIRRRKGVAPRTVLAVYICATCLARISEHNRID